ncbi:MAG: zinc ribbon domain-containing protein [Bacteroidetes bacterium]|nr:zinc ribbon domain-containing protein [Bacteroidota bacterium]MBU1115800.1 zinc ribbon domain-containing protein [Bacteroidota bacterium]MBU1800193.1 zinc ribbon domain-containing protein [Bacteroidota bacterium]
MPTYDYKCKECGITFELFQKMSDEPIQNCIECNGEVKRLIGSGLTPIFKGSGFYETDYKSKSSNTATKTKNGIVNTEKNVVKSDSVSSEKNETKSDSKNIESKETKKVEVKKSE